MARFDVFIAYARLDEGHARELYEALTKELEPTAGTVPSASRARPLTSGTVPSAS
ncbi:MAG: hypothetical protein GY719_42645 [bacterium]|nr:hypothetical protein [bacterium]